METRALLACFHTEQLESCLHEGENSDREIFLGRQRAWPEKWGEVRMSDITFRNWKSACMHNSESAAVANNHKQSHTEQQTD
jgi:hypothetical protein